MLVRRPPARCVRVSAVGARSITAPLRQVNEYEVQVTKMQDEFDRNWRWAGFTRALPPPVSRARVDTAGHAPLAMGDTVIWTESDSNDR